MSLVVHFLGHGMTPCMMQGVPAEWPQGHRWSGDWEDVTCEACLKGKDLIDTFVIAPDGKSITCKRCGRTSYSQGDVDQHWCEYCKVSHDDLWPPARLWWINHPGELTFLTCEKCGYRLGIRKNDRPGTTEEIWKQIGCPKCREEKARQSSSKS